MVIVVDNVKLGHTVEKNCIKLVMNGDKKWKI